MYAGAEKTGVLARTQFMQPTALALHQKEYRSKRACLFCLGLRNGKLLRTEIPAAP